jgi:hypothetical protein
MAYALATFSPFFMADIAHLTDLEELWKAERNVVITSNNAIDLRCQKDRKKKFFINHPRRPSRASLYEERGSMIQKYHFDCSQPDGVNARGTPSWLYARQYLLMEKATEWLKALKRWSSGHISPGACYRGDFWASSPHILIACPTGYDDASTVRMDTYGDNSGKNLMDYLIPFLPDDDASIHTREGFTARVMAELGNKSRAQGILYQMSNANGVVWEHYSSEEIEAAKAEREKKKPPPQPVERPSQLDPSKTTTRQVAAFLSGGP